MKSKFFERPKTASILGILLTLPALSHAEDYYRATKGYRTEPYPDPPKYVRNLSMTQFEQFRDITLLDVGLEHRSRYEYRENDLRFWTKTDPETGTSTKEYRPTPNNLLLMRTRAYWVCTTFSIHCDSESKARIRAAITIQLSSTTRQLKS